MVVAVRCGDNVWSRSCILGDFYAKIKSDINGLAEKHKYFETKQAESASSESTATLKKRKKAAILAAIGNAEISERTKKEIQDAVDREDLKLNTTIIGISMGAFIPGLCRVYSIYYILYIL